MPPGLRGVPACGAMYCRAAIWYHGLTIGLPRIREAGMVSEREIEQLKGGSEALQLPETLLPQIPEQARTILDYGCGAGERGALLRARNNAEVDGIAPEPDAAAAAQSKLDRVWQRPLGEVPLPAQTGRYDCILGIDLLPRLRDPDPVLAELRRILRPDGMLLLTVPNLQYYRTVLMLANGRWDYEETGIMARNHIRFYTGFEIVRLLKTAGLDILRLAGINQVPPEDLPRDENRRLHFGRISIGPLSEVEYDGFRTQEYLVFAGHAAEEDA
jgi:O-antigen biosynthesis protein